MIYYCKLNDKINLPIELNIMSIRQAHAALLARNYTELNLLDSTDVILKFDDLWFVSDLLLALTQEYRAAHGISESDVTTLLAGDVIDDVRSVLLAAYVDFFPGPETRESLRKFTQAMTSLISEKVKEVAERAAETLKNFSSATGQTLSD